MPALLPVPKQCLRLYNACLTSVSKAARLFNGPTPFRFFPHCRIPLLPPVFLNPSTHALARISLAPHPRPSATHTSKPRASREQRVWAAQRCGAMLVHLLFLSMLGCLWCTQLGCVSCCGVLAPHLIQLCKHSTSRRVFRPCAALPFSSQWQVPRFPQLIWQVRVTPAAGSPWRIDQRPVGSIAKPGWVCCHRGMPQQRCAQP